jgi:hypothetical protein
MQTNKVIVITDDNVRNLRTRRDLRTGDSADEMRREDDDERFESDIVAMMQIRL